MLFLVSTFQEKEVKYCSEAQADDRRQSQESG